MKLNTMNRQHLSDLQQALLALMQEPEKQKELAGYSALAGEEIVLAFADALEACLADSSSFSSSQNPALAELDAYIRAISGEAYNHIWLEESGLYGEEWQRIRMLARAAAAAFGWENLPTAPLYGRIVFADNR